MAKRLAETPNGIICRICGRDLPPYHFFKPRAKFNRVFFVSGIPDGHTCWDCGGPYRCISCGQIKPAADFRLQGRICRDCRIEGSIVARH